jgi:hypothetical protein
MRRLSVAALPWIVAMLVVSCSKLTDPTYEFMTLTEIDGKALPQTIKFGPDSANTPIQSGRLGLPDQSLGLSCRLDLVTGFTGFQRATQGVLSASACSNGDQSPIVYTGAIEFLDEHLVSRSSGTHTFTFSGLIRTKNP